MTGETILRICERPGMPGRTTVHRWLQNDKDFRKAYHNAAKVRAHELITESLAIADREKASIKDVAADRLRITTRLKLAAVMNPRMFTTRPARKPATPKNKDVTIHVIDHGSPEHLALHQPDPSHSLDNSNTDAGN